MLPDKPRHDQKAAADSEETREQADDKADAEQCGQEAPRGRLGESHVGILAACPAMEHERAHNDHQPTEEHEQVLALDPLAERGTEPCSRDARGSKDKRATPFDMIHAGMSEETEGCARRHCHRARTDRNMRRLDAHYIDEQRHGEQRAAAADKPERKAHEAAGAYG